MATIFNRLSDGRFEIADTSTGATTTYDRIEDATAELDRRILSGVIDLREAFQLVAESMGEAANALKRLEASYTRPPADERPLAGDAGRRERGRLQKRARLPCVRQQRLDLAPAHVVSRAQLGHDAGPLACWTGHDCVIYVLHLSPAFRCHQLLGTLLILLALSHPSGHF